MPGRRVKPMAGVKRMLTKGGNYCPRVRKKKTRTGTASLSGLNGDLFSGPFTGPGRIIVRRCSHVPWDSATALLLGAASAALGRGLRSVTFGAASAALCRSLLGVTFLSASARGAAASHHAGAR